MANTSAADAWGWASSRRDGSGFGIDSLRRNRELFALERVLVEHHTRQVCGIIEPPMRHSNGFDPRTLEYGVVYDRKETSAVDESVFVLRNQSKLLGGHLLPFHRLTAVVRFGKREAGI